eukprot:scaffold1206_cov388-Prasinococcus_capsulatus_cf.AAC.32
MDKVRAYATAHLVPHVSATSCMPRQWCCCCCRWRAIVAATHRRNVVHKSRDVWDISIWVVHIPHRHHHHDDVHVDCAAVHVHRGVLPYVYMRFLICCHTSVLAAAPVPGPHCMRRPDQANQLPVGPPRGRDGPNLAFPGARPALNKSLATLARRQAYKRVRPPARLGQSSRTKACRCFGAACAPPPTWSVLASS